jgi:hypothetical protein
VVTEEGLQGLEFESEIFPTRRKMGYTVGLNYG